MSQSPQSASVHSHPGIVLDAFRYVGTHGIPLEMVLSFYQKRNQIVAWDRFVEDAMKDGWKPRTILARCSAAVGDVFGSAYLREWLPRMETLLAKIKTASAG